MMVTHDMQLTFFVLKLIGHLALRALNFTKPRTIQMTFHTKMHGEDLCRASII